MQRAAPTAAEVQDALASVLARPEFTAPPPTGLSAWLGRIGDALTGFIASEPQLTFTTQGGTERRPMF